MRAGADDSDPLSGGVLMRWWGWIGIGIPVVVMVLTAYDAICRYRDLKTEEAVIVLVAQALISWMLWWAAWQ